MIIFVAGYFGESVPSNSGLVSIIKAHGDYGISGFASKHEPMKYTEGRTTEEILKTNGSAVVVFRNPFQAIYGYRHLNIAGHTGHANASQFIGPGLFVFEKMSQASLLIFNNILSRIIAEIY